MRLKSNLYATKYLSKKQEHRPKTHRPAGHSSAQSNSFMSATSFHAYPCFAADANVPARQHDMTWLLHSCAMSSLPSSSSYLSVLLFVHLPPPCPSPTLPPTSPLSVHLFFLGIEPPPAHPAHLQVSSKSHHTSYFANIHRRDRLLRTCRPRRRHVP